MIDALRQKWGFEPLHLLVGMMIVLLLGAAVPLYVESTSDSIAKLMVLPAIIALAFLILYSREALLLFIIFQRAATESLFEATRFSIAGIPIGLGGLLNAFAIVIAIFLIAERPRSFSPTILKVWGPFMLVLCVGTYNSPDPTAAVRLTLQWLANFSIFIAAYLFIRTEGNFKTAIKLVLFSSIIPTVAGLFQLATGTGYQTLDAGIRVNAMFNHPNIFAFYLTVVMALLLYVMKSSRFALSPARARLIGLYLLLMLALLVGTKTRSAWFAGVALFVGYGLLFERRYLVYIGVGGLCGLMIPEVRERILDLTHGGAQTVSSYDELNSFAWRIKLWTSAFRWMAPERFIYGYGVEAFKWNAPVFFDDFTRTHWGAHCVYVQLIFDTGIIGLLAFLSMYAQVLLRLRKLAKWDRLGAYIFIIMLVEFLVVAYSDNMLDYQSYNCYLWFVTGAGLALTELKLREKPVVEAGPKKSSTNPTATGVARFPAPPSLRT